MAQTELIPHLFRTEYSKIVAVLFKRFGIEHIENAEDIVSDTFLLAAETWGQVGVPKSPVAWLYTVAKNKTRDAIKHNNVFFKKIVPDLSKASSEGLDAELDLSAKNISDSQLKMMFAICHPSISVGAQIGLSLNILCGFGAEEIAEAFLITKDVAYKRLSRAKERLRIENVQIELPSAQEIEGRLGTVLTTLYLLFSEGYYSASQNTVLRKDLCIEALRLTLMLVDNEQTNTPSANALLSLMCFHSSRFEARINAEGNQVLYHDQDESLWNRELIEKGVYYLRLSSVCKQLSKYQIEAAIAYWHTHKADTQEKWESILQLYNKLLQLEYSPVAALNRTYALAKANSKDEAIVEAEKLALTGNHLYHMLLAELYADIDDEKSMAHLSKALPLARTEADRLIIIKKIGARAG